MAVEHANRILSWIENRSPKDVPPQWMWALDHETNAWFDRIAQEQGDGAEEPQGGVDNESLPEHVRKRT